VAMVRMWGFAEDPDGFDTGLAEGDPSSPGPPIVVPAGDDTLNIHLRNDLPADITGFHDTSIMIAGQEMPSAPAGTTPVWDDGTSGPRANLTQRVMSFTQQATADGGFATYSWGPGTGNPIRPGTYVYQSATHPAVQVQMGLYGAMTRDAAVGEAYAGVPYDEQVTLFYSEIDPVAHDAIAGTADGLTAPTYGTPSYPSTIGYRAQYFLINGDPYDPADPDSQRYQGLQTGERLLVRFLSASLATHVPTLNGLYMSVVAQDGNPLLSPRNLYSERLAAGRTFDAILTPTSAGSYAVYDHSMGLTNAAASPGGMIAFLEFTAP